ncbi:MAG: DUF4139 domain-containing protein [Bacteroidetes bacterium]|nr:DUF4139 domain-containing protein [Bacteroidota bacterium]
MNKIIFKVQLLVIFAFLFNQANAQDGENKVVSSKISKVTVYLSGAQITREAEVSVDKGVTNIIFEGISPYINDQSIQLGGTSGVNLLSVVHRINYLSNEDYTPRVKEINDSIEDIQFLLDQLANKKYVAEQEIDLIISNKSIKGDKGFDVAAFEEMQDIYAKKLPSLKDELLKTKIEERRLVDKQNKLRNQLSQLSNANNSVQHEIVASIKSDVAKKIKLELNYFSSAASWYPSYDIRCKDLASSIQLIYKANIQQTTGEDWSKVMLKISMGNPNLSGTKPELMTNALRWEESLAWGYGDASNENKKAVAPKLLENSVSVSYDKKDRYNNIGSTMSQTALNVEFSIAIPYSITSNGKYVLIDAQTFEMPATYSISAVPKLDKAAFLMAEVSSKDELSQLTGMASVYFEGMYTGQSSVVANENDSMKISLGRDKSILVERKRLKEKSSKSFLGSKKTEESTYEISVRNTKSTPITITVEDQIPVSTDKDIEVNKEDLAGAELDEATGKLTWKITLAAGETKKIQFSFNVKYPKNKRIISY